MKLKGKLIGKIVEKGMSVRDVAEQMDMDITTLRRKLKDLNQFKRGEIKEISLILGLTQYEILDIFFE